MSILIFVIRFACKQFGTEGLEPSSAMNKETDSQFVYVSALIEDFNDLLMAGENVAAIYVTFSNATEETQKYIANGNYKEIPISPIFNIVAVFSLNYVPIFTTFFWESNPGFIFLRTAFLPIRLKQCCESGGNRIRTCDVRVKVCCDTTSPYRYIHL